MRRFNWQAAGAALVIVVVLTAGTALASSVSSNPLYVTTGEAGHGPGDQVTALFPGVATLDIAHAGFGVRGTGALLLTGRHILTAAHLFEASAASVTVAVGGMTVTTSSWTIHPGWDGDTNHGYDIAIIELPDVLVGVPTYDIYRLNDEIGMVGDKVGYGISGIGVSGADSGSYPYGVKRWGQNKYDSLADYFKPAFWGFDFQMPDGSVLMYDFDDGTNAHDGFGFWKGPTWDNDTLGGNEVMAGNGDSGGPTFLNGLIAGITSFGTTFATFDLNGNLASTDIDWPGGNVAPTSNASFGEFGSDTRVSYYANWIDSVIAVPEPGTMALLGFGLLAMAGLGLRRRKH